MQVCKAEMGYKRRKTMKELLQKAAEHFLSAEYTPRVGRGVCGRYPPSLCAFPMSFVV